MAPTPPGNLEGRPPPAEASPLQARIDAAAPGSTVEVLRLTLPLEVVAEIALARVHKIGQQSRTLASPLE